MIQLGLIGLPLIHSKSPLLFKQFFEQDFPGIPAQYDLYPLDTINELPQLLLKHHNLSGLNVTIPYKKQVLPYISVYGEGVRETGVVNTIAIIPSSEANLPIPGFCLHGFNTDIIGFREMIKPHIRAATEHALILGNGASASSIAFVLKNLGIKCSFVSQKNQLDTSWNYTNLTSEIVSNFPIIVNTTPVGQFPNINETLPFPFDGIREGQLLIDLIYNPEETVFLKEGRKRGAVTLNGKTMLEIQAQQAWNIWKSKM